MEGERLSGDRMLDRCGGTVQGDSPGKGKAAAVAGISGNAVAGGGQLHADLMLATGLQLNFQQGCLIVSCELAVVQQSLAGVGGTSPGHFHSAGCFVVTQPVFQLAAGNVRSRGNQCEIDLPGLVQTNLLAEPCGCLRCAGEDEYAGDHGIQPTHHTQINFPLFLKSAANIIDSDFKGRAFAWPCSHGGAWCGFVDDVEMVVFVKQLHGVLGKGSAGV